MPFLCTWCIVYSLFTRWNARLNLALEALHVSPVFYYLIWGGSLIKLKQKYNFSVNISQRIISFLHFHIERTILSVAEVSQKDVAVYKYGRDESAPSVWKLEVWNLKFCFHNGSWLSGWSPFLFGRGKLNVAIIRYSSHSHFEIIAIT